MNKLKKNQMTLDFGQKDLGLKQCKECNMIYNLDDKQDTELHSRYHRQQDNILKFSSCKNEKVVQEYASLGRCIVIESDIDPKIQLTKALNLLKYVDVQLGIRNSTQILEEIDSKMQVSTTLAQAPLTSTNDGNSCKYYLFINRSNRVIGFCLAEQLSKEYRIRKLSDECDEENAFKSVICGISRIWVDKNYRRNKIATKLLDCVRENFIYFEDLKFNQIAFSDPTDHGKQLATSYCKTKDFYIYFK
jgi:N-acetyltransferase